MREVWNPVQFAETGSVSSSERDPASIVAQVLRISGFGSPYLMPTGTLPQWWQKEWPTQALSEEELLRENILLRVRNSQLEHHITDLESRVERLEAFAPELKVIVLREIGRNEAREEIRELFASGEVLGYSDIVERLQLDLELVVSICNEMMDEGEIGATDAGVHKAG